ncbi:alpha/beta hydrolase [Hymenobacter cheonanensis]|uniref:alpha/beta hydrolase n=1 Tax=Hymenobacter sp. CA2-7 TaxID=3063993 RepID=UPI002713EFFE|nr:alpha/beta hydrolase-fold protein [Hymenobacter sp. CA2-7]MDO7883907.1 alpha/beta hydrolase-fold protein [Hymenobacter sp. CA2-7]
MSNSVDTNAAPARKPVRWCGLWLGLALAGPAASAQTTLRITAVPATTPAGQALYVAGSFNSWQPADPSGVLARQPDGSYQLTLPASVRGPQEFKFTRGSWAAAEATAQYQPVANRQATFSGEPTTLTFQVAAWQDQRPGGTPAPGPKAHTRAPNVRVLADSFRLPQLGGRARRVWLYLPPGYGASPHRRYPVLYLQDGQNIFDEATAFAGEWGVDETLNRLAREGQDPTGCLVVAIDNGGARRLDEYSPWVNAEYKKGGEGDQYTDFLALTLKPYIDAHYRTRPDAAHTAVAGSSMGGLIAFYAGLKYPQVFGRIGVFSPAIWFAKDSLLRYEQRRPAPLASRFYFVAGPAESETMVPLMNEVRQGLLAKGVAPSHIAFKAPADGRHAEWFWRREFGPAYRWLLAK